MKYRQTAVLGLMVTLAFMISYLESVILAPVSILGLKIGLGNMLIVWLLYDLGWRQALGVNICRILLSALLFTNPMALAFSLAGGLFSFTAMCAGKKSGLLPMTGVSILGGVFHNIGQALMAALFFSAYAVRSYLPMLLVLGLVTGAFNGGVASVLHRRLGGRLRLE